jgi:hypothetical protein
MSRIPPISNMPKRDTLWSGSKQVSGTITLQGSITNYDFIIVRSVTNVDNFTDILVPTLNIGQIINHWSGYGSDVNYPHYRSQLWIKFTASNLIGELNELHNNVNWQLGLIEVIGVKL